MSILTLSLFSPRRTCTTGSYVQVRDVEFTALGATVETAHHVPSLPSSPRRPPASPDGGRPPAGAGATAQTPTPVLYLPQPSSLQQQQQQPPSVAASAAAAAIAAIPLPSPNLDTVNARLATLRAEKERLHTKLLTSGASTKRGRRGPDECA